MPQIPACPVCAMENTYPGRQLCLRRLRARVADRCGGASCGRRDDRQDVNGNVLVAGDTVTVIKDLKVKGSCVGLKQGTVIRNIRLVDGDAENIEGNSDKIKGLVLKTCFLKKA